MTKQVFPDRDSLIEGAARYIADHATQAISARGSFHIALSGGNTPKPIYARLAAAPYLTGIDWSRVQIYFGDERCVPPEDPRSNYHMARTALLDHVPLPADNIHRIRGEESPERAAELYLAELQKAFGSGAAASSFDLVLLGMGDNGHTASIFPGLPAVTEQSRWVMAQYVEVMEMWRVTLTPVVINAAREVAFLVSGADKAEMLSKVVDGPRQPIVLPSQSIKPAGDGLCWLLDAPAASLLKAKA